MSLPLEDIIITIDTREQNQKRIKAVETWGIAQGAIVEHSKLDLCDYRILGDFRGNEINIGIEAKSLNDFCSCNYEDLKRKLFDSFELYDEVALFIESANYSFLNEGFGKSAIINPAVRDGSADVCNLAQLEGCCSTLPAYGIHVRQLRSEAQFPYSIENLLSYCIHDHDIIKTPKMYLKAYQHTLRSFMTNVQVKKAITCYPNLHWLCSAGEDAYKEIFGKKTGTQIYNYVRNPELMTEEWKSGKFQDGTDKIQVIGTEIINEVLKSQCDPAGKSILKTALSTSPENPADDNDKATKGFFPPKLNPSVAIPNHTSTTFKTPPPETKMLGDTDQGASIIPTPLSSGHVQEKDLKIVSSSISPSPVTPDTELDIGINEPLPYTVGDEKPLSTHRISARVQLEGYLQNPHTLKECVDKFNVFTSGTIFEHIARMKREGVVVEFDNGTLVIAK